MYKSVQKKISQNKLNQSSTLRGGVSHFVQCSLRLLSAWSRFLIVPMEGHFLLEKVLSYPLVQLLLQQCVLNPWGLGYVGD